VNKCGFRFNDKKYSFKTAKDTYLNALRVLKKNCPTLYEVLNRDLNTGHVGYFVKNPDDIYKSSPKLADKDGNIEKLEDGWYTSTILSNKQKEALIMYACSISKVNYLYDLEIWFDGGNNKYTPISKEEAEIELDRMLKGFL